MKQEKKTKLVTLIGIVTLLLVVIGATYAYFTAQMGDGATTDINVVADTTDSLTFENEGEININASEENFNKNLGSITDEATVRAKLKANSTSKTATMHYNIYLIIDYNDFVYSRNDKPELLVKLTGPNNEESYKTFSELEYVSKITDRKSNNFEGYDITTKNHKVYKLVSNYEITATDESETVHDWKAEVTFVNYDWDQLTNSGKRLKGSLYITTDDTFSISQVNEIKATTTENSITIKTTATSGTNEISKYYYKLEKVSDGTNEVSGYAEHQLGVYEEGNATETFDNLDTGASYKISCVVVDSKNYVSNVYETAVIKADGNELPEIESIATEETSYSIKVIVTPKDAPIITNYSYKLDDGEWSDWETSEHTFTDLNQFENHIISIKGKTTDGQETNIKIIKVTTALKKGLSDVCPLGTENLADCIKLLNTTYPKYEETSLYLHDTSLENGSGDNSYRYAGFSQNVNNWVCFGAGAEDYTNGESKLCPETNKYRIIGLFKNNSGQYEVKLIKADYIKESELNGGEETILAKKIDNIRPRHTKFYDGNQTEIDAFFWTGNLSVNYNNWVQSWLNKALNSNEGYLKFLGNDWTEKITNHEWIIAGTSIPLKNDTPSEAYNNELGNGKHTTSSITCTDTSTTIVQCRDDLLKQTNKIGLMYVNDYAFAASDIKWTMNLFNYGWDAYEGYNWLYQSVAEWTITRAYESDFYPGQESYFISSSGSVYEYYVFVKECESGVRPVFYLKSDVTFGGGNGTKTTPYKIVL